MSNTTIEDITIIDISLHHIDLEEEIIKEINIASRKNDKDIKHFTNTLVANIFKASNNKKYELKTPNLNMGIITNKYDNNFTEKSKIIAKDLLEIEKKTNDRLKKTLKNSVQRGSLIQIIFKKETVHYTFISKIEHDEFMDEENMITRIGMSIRKMETLKYFLWNNKSDMYILGDTSNRVSKYWWDTFFGLKELRNDQENTSNAIELIEGVIDRIRKKSPEDYKIYNNAFKSYFSTQENFVLDDFFHQVFGTTSPQNKKVDLNKIKETISNKVKNNKFDSNFTIDKESLKKKPKKYDLGGGIKLEVPITFDKKSGRVKIEEDREGNKVIQIRTTEKKALESFS